MKDIVTEAEEIAAALRVAIQEALSDPVATVSVDHRRGKISIELSTGEASELVEVLDFYNSDEMAREDS